jgi:hypothetical protein
MKEWLFIITLLLVGYALSGCAGGQNDRPDIHVSTGAGSTINVTITESGGQGGNPSVPVSVSVPVSALPGIP